MTSELKEVNQKARKSEEQLREGAASPGAKVSPTFSSDKGFSGWSLRTPEQGCAKCSSLRATCVGITLGLLEAQIPSLKPAKMS